MTDRPQEEHDDGPISRPPRWRAYQPGYTAVDRDELAVVLGFTDDREMVATLRWARDQRDEFQRRNDSRSRTWNTVKQSALVTLATALVTVFVARWRAIAAWALAQVTGGP